MRKLLFLLVIPILLSCEKDESTPVQIRMTDAIGDFKEVNIELKEVQVKMYNQDWINLITSRGVYNLLDFRDGVDTIIARGTVPEGTLKEIRLVLGTQNSLVLTNDSTVELSTVNIPESKIELTINKNTDSALDILIDFDAGQSVHFEEGIYKLNPVLLLKK